MRENENDFVKKFAVRNKDSPIDEWQDFKPYSRIELYLNLFTSIDGIKLKFNKVTLIINGRHKSK